MNVNRLPLEFIHKRSTKKEGKFVSEFPFTTINPVTSKVTCTAYKCQNLNSSTNYKHKKEILLNALPESLNIHCPYKIYQ